MKLNLLTRWMAVAFILLLASAPIVSAPLRHVLRVRDFGAIGDGKTLDTPALQRAIDAAAAAGGGNVEVPPGVFLTSSLFLKSHTHLLLDKGATIDRKSVV